MDFQLSGTIAVLLASGLGSRFGGSVPKQFQVIAGKTILEHSIRAFDGCAVVDHVVLVTHPDFFDKAAKICQLAGFAKLRTIVHGGASRFDSSRIGVSQIADTNAKVLIHDVARPCVSRRLIKDCVDALDCHDAVTAAVPASDTIFKAEQGEVTDIPPRSAMHLVQTPQGFRASTIQRAHALALADKAEPTDDCSLVVRYHTCGVHLVEGEYTNIKVTHPIDLVVASSILAAQWR